MCSAAPVAGMAGHAIGRYGGKSGHCTYLDLQSSMQLQTHIKDSKVAVSFEVGVLHALWPDNGDDVGIREARKWGRQGCIKQALPLQG